MTSGAPTRAVDELAWRPVWPAVVRSTAAIVVLLIGFALGLRALDEFPGLATGVARGVRRIDSLPSLERHLGRSMPIPAYFPDTLTWPPQTLLLVGGTSASMSFGHRQTGVTWLIVAIGVGTASVAPQILPPASPLQTESTVVRQAAATVERLLDRDGAIWYQLTWHELGTTRLVRYRGTLDDVMLIANSIDERGR